MEWYDRATPHAESRARMIAKRTGQDWQDVMREEIGEQPELPSHLVPVWEAWNILHSQRHIGQAGPQALSLSDMISYFDLAGPECPSLRAWTIDLLLHLDHTFRKKTNDQMKKERRKQRHKASSSTGGGGKRPRRRGK